MALARDKAHDSIKISDAGKAYLPDEKWQRRGPHSLRKGCGRGS